MAERHAWGCEKVSGPFFGSFGSADTLKGVVQHVSQLRDAIA
jgi:hypothetical protein